MYMKLGDVLYLPKFCLCISTEIGRILSEPKNTSMLDNNITRLLLYKNAAYIDHVQI